MRKQLRSFTGRLPRLARVSGRKSDSLKRSAAHQILIAVEHRDLNGNIATRDNTCRGLSRGQRDLVTQRKACGTCEREGLRGGNCRRDAVLQIRRTACRLGELGERRKIDLAALGVQIGQTLRQLRYFSDS